MSSDIYMHLVKEMYKKFGIDYKSLPTQQNEKNFRIAALQEELDEFSDAEPNTADELDALVDMAVFLFGTVERLNYTEAFPEAYRRVMVSNMSKELGPNNKRGSFEIDIRKPEGFKPADLEDLV
jgi:hypothetical protein